MLIFGNSQEDIYLKLEKIITASGCKFEIIKNQFGKPYLKSKNLYFNVSHCKGLSVAIIEKTECGIDIEEIRKYDNAIALKICTCKEYKFLNKTENKDYYFTALWVLKESYLKCLGMGISIPMSKINFIKDDELCLDLNEFSISILDYNNCIIAICRK